MSVECCAGVEVSNAPPFRPSPRALMRAADQADEKEGPWR